MIDVLRAVTSVRKQKNRKRGVKTHAYHDRCICLVVGNIGCDRCGSGG